MASQLTAAQRQLTLRLQARELSLRERSGAGRLYGSKVWQVEVVPAQRPPKPDGWVPGPGRLRLADREASRSTSATRTHPGSADPTRTPTAYCASTCPEAPTCQRTPPPTSPASSAASTTAPARPSAK